MRSDVQHALQTLDFRPIVTQLYSESEVGVCYPGQLKAL